MDTQVPAPWDTDEHEHTYAHTLYTQTGTNEELLIFNISEWESKYYGSRLYHLFRKREKYIPCIGKYIKL